MQLLLDRPSLMEFFACILGGLALMAVSCGLFLIRPPDWRSEEDKAANPTELTKKRFAGLQRSLRYFNNGLLMFIGGGIFASAFVPHGRGWMLLWTGILISLLLSVLLALIDALTSMAGYRRALPEAARRTLGRDHDLA